ncbi:MAG: hypothetical protein F6J90_26230 [Moorea sp. SIOASIH]|uniref:hypothetical protein n=1 Tax=Moorena sp. SIOASIH TaxID=2607817 RepID=UPI0013BA815A|nr:hypothetical protein [Moorena sp. SIOASIH]NEO39639.1 hypothetical protein [Moorena sp. SIOASIH]
MTTVSKSEKLKEIQEAYKNSNKMAYELCRVFEQVWQVAPDESALAIANKIMLKDISYFMFVFDLDTEEGYSEKLKQASKESFRSRREWRQKLEDLEEKKQLEAEEEEVKENLLNLLNDSSAETDSKIRENLLDIVKACL